MKRSTTKIIVGLFLIMGLACSKQKPTPAPETPPPAEKPKLITPEEQKKLDDEKKKLEEEKKKKLDEDAKRKTGGPIILEEGLEYEFVGPIQKFIVDQTDYSDYFVHAFKIKQDKFKIKIVSFQENKADYKTPKVLRDELDARIIINGGFYGDDKTPNIADGLLILEGKKISDINPNLSGVLTIQENILSIIETDKFKIEDMKADTFAIQGTPRLVERGGKIGIEKPDLKTTKDKRTPRTAICTTIDGNTLLMVTDREKSGLYLYEMAQVAKFLNCDITLNLDGGPATSISVKDYTHERYKDVEIPAGTGWIHPNLIVIE